MISKNKANICENKSDSNELVLDAKKLFVPQDLSDLLLPEVVQAVCALSSLFKFGNKKTNNQQQNVEPSEVEMKEYDSQTNFHEGQNCK